MVKYTSTQPVPELDNRESSGGDLNTDDDEPDHSLATHHKALDFVLSKGAKDHHLLSSLRPWLICTCQGPAGRDLWPRPVGGAISLDSVSISPHRRVLVQLGTVVGYTGSVQYR